MVFLEKDLLRRLDNNLIKTENDLAWANADWGDIAALREALDAKWSWNDPPPSDAKPTPPAGPPPADAGPDGTVKPWDLR